MEEGTSLGNLLHHYAYSGQIFSSSACVLALFSTPILITFSGIIATGGGVILLFFMPGDSIVTRLLNEERKIAVARIDADQGGQKEPTSLKLILQSLCNVNVGILLDYHDN
jgi:hypothetical protein